MAVWNLVFCASLLLGSIGFGNSQRKQGRNIAVVSEGKSHINFDCPEEFGYYPHPTDCTQYYVCVFGGALLESCTGGLMYSHELQTCDWPRNVGCDGVDTVSVSSPGGDVRVSVQPAARAPAREERVRYTVVPTAQPQPVISSRGQSRQLHATVHERVHPPQDIISKQQQQQQQQQQLYADADDSLPPAEEVENDRQQRVYRGQPSTVGQVQRDRDGLRHTNAIPTSSRAEKIGVISFGTQQQQPVQQYRSRLEESNANTQTHSNGASQSANSGRTLYNGSQHYDPSQYDPYYTLYEDDVELYRDVDYTQQQQYTNNRAQPQQVYRGTPAPILAPVQSTVQEEIPQRNSAYYSTQAQDVYSQNYQDDNYDTQVDDQSNYRQSSRQPSRLPIIAANQTRPKSITITLSASPGQNLPATQSPNTTTTTERKNETDSSIPNPPSHFISLSTGFNLRQTDNNSEPTPVTYKPHFTQISSTTNLSNGMINKPLPFSLTRLPNNETKSVVFRLSSNLSAFSPNVSDAENQAAVVDSRSTESPYKREIVGRDQVSAAQVKSVVSTHIIPTTYSPPKSLLASIIPRHSENESFKNIGDTDSSEEQLVSILPRKTIKFSKPATESTNVKHQESVKIESSVPHRTRGEDNDKPFKTIIRKLPMKVENNTSSPNTEKTKEERKIISKIHFGIPHTYTSPERINNLATTPGSLEDNFRLDDSRSEKLVHRYRPANAHYITIDLTTTKRPSRLSTPSTTQVSFSSEDNDDGNSDRFRASAPIHYKSTTERGNSIKYTPSSFESEYFDNIEQRASPISQTKFSFNYNLHPTTEKANIMRYSTSTTENSKLESPRELLSDEERQRSEFPLNSNFRPTVQSISYVKHIPSTSEKKIDSDESSSDKISNVERTNSRKFISGNGRQQVKIYDSDSRFNLNLPKYITSNTTGSSTTSKEISDSRESNNESTNNRGISSSNEKLQSRISVSSIPRPTISSPNYMKYNSFRTTDKTRATGDSNAENNDANKDFSLSSHLFSNKNNLNYMNYETSSTKKASIVDEDSNKEKLPPFRLSFDYNSDGEQRNKYFSTSESPDTEKASSTENFHKFIPNTSFNPSAEQKSYFKYSSTTDKYKFLEVTEDSTGDERSSFEYFPNESSSTESELDFAQPSSTTEQSSSSKYLYSTSNSRTYNKFSSNSNPDQTNVARSNKQNFNPGYSGTSPINRKPIFRFVYNPAPISSTERSNSAKYEYSTTESHAENEARNILKSSTTTSKNIPSIGTSRPLHQFSTTTTQHTSTAKYLSSSMDSTSSAFRYSTTTHASTITSSTDNSMNNITNISTPDRVTGKYRFVQSSGEISDPDEKVRSKLYINRNIKPFRATAELPTVSEILATQDETPKKEIDNPPTYKPKPFSLTDNQNRTSADTSRNFTLPVRLSRVNTAIKSLTAFGGTRRNSQTPKCNENQTTPDTKCNEIQKLRASTRGRGSAHYTSSSAGESPSINVNRGTPATPRSRPTLKPSTSIVSKASEFVDIYRYPPHRPEAIYPQPQVDKTAAKCRKDVCLLPDCSCGGKEIPGDIPAEEVPQMVLLTFDDAVNDLNRATYIELFEQGRTNPNGCPISATFYVSHEWTDYSQVQNLYADGHELASHTVSHSFGEQFSQRKWNREVSGQREILAAYGGVHLEDVRGMRAPFLSVGGNKMFKMLYDSNFTYDSSLPVYENRPPSWPYTLDYKLFHDCMIPPCPTRSYPGVWEVPMVMWQDLNGGRCSMGDACSNPADSDGVFKMLMKNFERHYTTNRAPFGLFYHAAWFTQPHHKEGFIKFLDFLVSKDDVYLVTNWQAIQWVREPTPLNRVKNFHGFQCNYGDRPKRCNNPKVCNLWHKSGVRYMKTCQPCPDIYPWTGKTGIRSSRIDNDIED